MKTRLPPPRHFSRAFTLVEILVVIVIIAILAAVAIPVVNLAVARAQRLQTQATMHDLAAAVSNYRTQYNRFPVDASLIAGAGDEDAPAFQTDGSVEIINILTARIDPAKTPNPNPAHIPFLNLPPAKRGSFGIVDNTNGETDGAPLELHDIWGQPYFILLDTNYDNRVKNPDVDNGDMTIRHNPKFLSGQTFIYSAGPDRIPNTKDDICSWR